MTASMVCRRQICCLISSLVLSLVSHPRAFKDEWMVSRLLREISDKSWPHLPGLVGADSGGPGCGGKIHG